MLYDEKPFLDAEEIRQLAHLIGEGLEPGGITDPVDRDNARRLYENLPVLALEMEPGAFLELQ